MKCHKHMTEDARYLSHFPEEPRISCDICFVSSRRREKYTHLSLATQRLNGLLNTVDDIKTLKDCLDSCSDKIQAIMDEISECYTFINHYETFRNSLQGPNGLKTFLQTAKNLPQINSKMKHFINFQRAIFELALSVHSQQQTILNIYNMSNIQSGLQTQLVTPSHPATSFPLFCQCPSTIILRQEYLRLAKTTQMYRSVLNTPQGQYKLQLEGIYQEIRNLNNTSAIQLLEKIQNSQKQQQKQLQLITNQKNNTIQTLQQQIVVNRHQIEQLTTKLREIRMQNSQGRQQIEKISLLFNKSIILRDTFTQLSMAETLVQSNLQRQIQYVDLVKRIESGKEHTAWLTGQVIENQYQDVIFLIWLKEQDDEDQKMVFITNVQIHRPSRRLFCGPNDTTIQHLSTMRTTTILCTMDLKSRQFQRLNNSSKILIGKSQIQINSRMKILIDGSKMWLSTAPHTQRREVRSYEIFGVKLVA